MPLLVVPPEKRPVTAPMPMVRRKGASSINTSAERSRKMRRTSFNAIWSNLRMAMASIP